MKACLVHPVLSVPDKQRRRSGAVEMEESVGLARALDLKIEKKALLHIKRKRAATFFGKGQVERIGEMSSDAGADLIVVTSALSPVQQRNLEQSWNRKVLDKTALILEIFGDRARTAEARLQVDWAHLNYQRSRLVRSWTHLERQRGGAGFMGGPGETQVEADRREIDKKMMRIRRQLESVRKRRQLHRKGRKRKAYRSVALVGYTNAGKSTLFNKLTGAKISARSRLFDTLDPTTRALNLPNQEKVLLSDTVGFISDLPPDLISAFRATLEEVKEASLIIHVRDIAHPDREAQKRDVESVLQALGVGEEKGEERGHLRL